MANRKERGFEWRKTRENEKCCIKIFLLPAQVQKEHFQELKGKGKIENKN